MRRRRIRLSIAIYVNLCQLEKKKKQKKLKMKNYHRLHSATASLRPKCSWRVPFFCFLFYWRRHSYQHPRRRKNITSLIYIYTIQTRMCASAGPRRHRHRHPTYILSNIWLWWWLSPRPPTQIHHTYINLIIYGEKGQRNLYEFLISYNAVYFCALFSTFFYARSVRVFLFCFFFAFFSFLLFVLFYFNFSLRCILSFIYLFVLYLYM